MRETVVDLNLNMWTIYFTLFNAFILFVILKRLLFKPVMAIIENRKAVIQTEFENAENANKEAAAMKEQYEFKLSNIEEEKRSIIQEAREMSGMILQKGKSETEKEKARILKNTEKEVRLMYENAREELKRETAELSIDVAQEILKKEIDRKTHAQLINDIIRDLSEVKA